MKQGLTGLIGGSGLGDVLADKIEDAKFHDVKTPFGKPSDRIMIGKIGKRQEIGRASCRERVCLYV